MDSLRVSVIVPVYNVSDYILRCIDSVIQQSYTNIECILVDDGTPDDSIVLAERKLAQYQGPVEFIIAKHKHNQGISCARNTGISIAKGDYVMYLDSDDELLPRSIELLAGLACKYPDAQIITGNLTAVDEFGNKRIYNKRYVEEVPEYINDKKVLEKEFFETGNGFLNVTVWNKLMKRSFLENNNIAFRPGIIHEDQLYMFRIMQCVETMAFCRESTYVHYHIQGSIMHSGSNLKSIKSWLAILAEIFEDFDTLAFNERKYYYQKLLGNYFRINMNSEESSLLPGYRDLIKNLRKKTLSRFLLGEYVVLCLFGLPRRFYPLDVVRRCKPFLIRLFQTPSRPGARMS